MPVLHNYANGSGFYVKSHIEGAIVTFQLLRAGVERLAEAGFKPGDVFPLRVLGELCQAGEAYTRRKGNRNAPGYYNAEQFEFSFTEEIEVQALEKSGVMLELPGLFAT
jgi:hypothetical protein